MCKRVLVLAPYLLGDDFNFVAYLVSWVIYGGTSQYHRQPNQPCLFSLSAPTVSTSSKRIMLCKRLQRQSSDPWCILVILPERAMGYIGFYCISVEKLYFFNTPFTLECSFKPLFRAHAGFIITQLKTLSISRGCQRNNNTLITDRPFSSLGTAMYLKKVFFAKVVFFHQKFRNAFLAFFSKTQK